MEENKRQINKFEKDFEKAEATVIVICTECEEEIEGCYNNCGKIFHKIINEEDEDIYCNGFVHLCVDCYEKGARNER